MVPDTKKPGAVPTTLLHHLAGGDICLTVTQMAEALGVTRLQASNAAARLIRRDYLVKMAGGCFQLSDVGRAAAEAGTVITSGPMGKRDAVAVYRDTFRQRAWASIRFNRRFTISQIVRAAARNDEKNARENPYYSDAANQGWINGLQGPVLGSGRAVHRHGTTPDLQGWRPGEFGVSLPGQNALPAAQLERFGAMAATATQNLGTLGNGFDVFGNALAQGVSGGGAAGGGGFLNLLMGGFASAIGIPGFASGGTHKGGLRIVGERGPELEYTGPSTILPADLTRSIMSGSSPATRMASAPVIQSNLTINPINNSGAQLKVEAQETTNARGERQVDLVMSDMVANAITVPGGRADRAMRSKYGVKRRGIRR